MNELEKLALLEHLKENNIFCRIIEDNITVYAFIQNNYFLSTITLSDQNIQNALLGLKLYSDTLISNEEYQKLNNS